LSTNREEKIVVYTFRCLHTSTLNACCINYRLILVIPDEKKINIELNDIYFLKEMTCSLL